MTERITFEAWLNNVMSKQLAVIERDGKKTFNTIDHEIAQVDRRMAMADNTAGKLGKRLVGMFSIAAIGYAAIRIGQAITETTAKYQKFEAVLTNTLGSKSAAQKSFKDIETFASKTPFQVDEITDSYVRLTNQGFQPTMQQMRALGDIASSKGKSFGQLTEALIDAEVGEFERLKEFGIRANKEGDKITFTFKGQKQTVDNTSESIRAYVLGLGNAAGVAGAMAKISETTGGKISNMKDNMDKLSATLGERFKNAIDGGVEGAGRFVSILTQWAAIPLSDKMEDERIQVNLLASELTRSETPLERRNIILEKLREISPDIVEGIKAEAIEMDRLRSNVQQYNMQMIQRIVLQEKQEEQEKKQKKAEKKQRLAGSEAKFMSDLFAEAERVLIDRGQTEEANKLRDLTLSGKDFSGQAEDVSKYLQSIGGLKKTVMAGGTPQEVDYVGMIQGARGRFKSAEKTARGYQSIADEARAEMEAFAKAMGLDITKEEDGTSQDDITGSAKTASDPVSKALGGVTGDNRQVKNITINIEKLGGVENIHISKDGEEEDINKFLDKLRQGLMTVVNDATLIAQ